MTATSPRPITVGVDGSTSARHAVRWAAKEADRRNAPLRLVHVTNLVLAGYPEPVVHYPEYVESVLDQGRWWLREAADIARAATETIEIGTDLRDGTIASVLINESVTAQLMVLGSRGLGGFEDLLVGSIAIAVAAHGRCPVVVVRSSTVDAPLPETGPVVVGVGTSPLGDAAIGFSFDAAATRRVPLLAVHAWQDVHVARAWTAPPLTVDWTAVQADKELVLAERLAGWQHKHPEVDVRPIVTRSRPAHALIEYGKGAQLIVVGSRGHGVLAGLRLGSVSQALLHHAECPVAVVRSENSQES